MRIAVVSSPVTPLRPAQVGGAQAFVCDLATGLAGRGHDVVLYCAEGSEVDGVRLATVPAPRDARAALVMPGGGEPLPAPGVEAALSAMFESIAAAGFDVVSQHAFDAPAFRLARNLPVVHTLHLPPIVEARRRRRGGARPAQRGQAGSRAEHFGGSGGTRGRPHLTGKRNRARDRSRDAGGPAGECGRRALRSGLCGRPQRGGSAGLTASK
ncbi:MAG: glycosyltransferase family 4 protein [Chloroflexi bacterium]|nr:MAG: glycosyltransferase family 4 protein [Chloroflexota bacterium]